MTEPDPIFCFGEILWDALPRGLFPGGAPVNVAYHLQRLRNRPIPLTAVGADHLGDELLRRLRAWHIDTSGVTVLPAKRTGLARVSLDAGSPRFEIVEDAAWDWIQLPPAAMEHSPGCAAIVFGSLAQRSESNRKALTDLLERCPRALRVFDVNLRAPYDAIEPVWSLARLAGLIKLNDHELGVLLNKKVSAGELPAAARELARRLALTRVCVTAGDAGAGLLLGNDWFWEPANPVPVRDTVGAGDAFLAALLHGLLRPGHSPAEVLRRACHLAEFVTTRDGATPGYQVDAQGHVTACDSL